jgi:hypothetical protein
LFSVRSPEQVAFIISIGFPCRKIYKNATECRKIGGVGLMDQADKMVLDWFEGFLNMCVEEQRARLKTEEIRLKMLLKVKETMPKLYREINRPVKMPKFPRVAK